MSATPTVLIITHTGEEIDWHVGYGPPPEKYIERLEKSAKGIDTFQSLSRLYKKDPKNVDVVFKLAQKYNYRYTDEAQQMATKLFQEVLALDPKGEKGTTEYGEDKVTYTEYAEFSLAQASLFPRGAATPESRNPGPMTTFIQKYPQSKMLQAAYSALSSYYQFAGSKEEAQAFFEEYVAKYPEDPSVLYSYVRRIIRDKEPLNRGLELAKKIDELTRYNPVARYRQALAQIYGLQGDWEKAEEVFGKRFMEGRANSLAYDLIDYARFWIEQNRNLESAESMLDMALRLNPETSYIRYSAAGLYVRLKKEEKALQIFGPEYIKDKMKDPSNLDLYASFWANQKKNLDSALEAAKRLIELSPKNGSYWMTLGSVYRSLENYSEALKAYEKALELVTRESMKKFIQKTIEDLQKIIKEKSK
ncbi:MAG: tetratricopeptide repeat protein [Candidatus Aminicenantes bacterium]|nr:tetratricopeptide repeat protein [Candidatus Aminicenantes bacterium]